MKTMKKELTDSQIAENARKKLKELKQEYAEINELRETYSVKAEWHKEMLRIVGKEMLLKEILGIDEE